MRRSAQRSAWTLLLPAAAAAALLVAPTVGSSTGSWTATASMAVPRQQHTATLLRDGRVLAAGGVTTGPRATESAELYHPATGTWSPAAPMLVARSRHIAVVLANGTVLVAGGRTPLGTTATAELYDPLADVWTPTGSMSVARDNFTATQLADGRVLVAGGVGGDGSGTVVEKSADLYDPATGTWTQTGKMAKHRFNHSAVRLDDGRVLVTGGAGPGGDCIYTGASEIYSPETGDWKTTDPMATPRGIGALQLLTDGTVLAAGGLTQPASCKPPAFAATASAELYDAGEGRWRPTAPLAVDRRAFGEAQLADGDVLLAGGRDSDGALLASAERYAAAAATWEPAGAMTVPRVGHRLTALADGRVLATGGGQQQGNLLASAELYTP